jgi:tRNA pseudouridine55 synthase
MDGVLIVDKPAGPTSHDVVAATRRALGISKIGHTGTLDPLATGVLPLVVGRATRLASLLSGAEKEYLALVRFGTSTSTYDAESVRRPNQEKDGWHLPGKGANHLSPEPDADPGARHLFGEGASHPAQEPDPDGKGGWHLSAEGARHPLPTEAEIDAALPAFRGTYSQMPPPFSAKKVGGTPAYKLARQQKPVELKPVDVTVRELELHRYADGAASLRLVCSSGFYVRSLAHDLGQRLGCGAHLESLRRTRAGTFEDADAVPLDTIVREGALAVQRLIPLDRLLPELPAVVLSEPGAKRASHGNDVGPQDLQDGKHATWNRQVGSSRLRLLDGRGGLLGIAEPVDGGFLHPLIVLV